MTLLLIALGGAVGALARYGLSRWVQDGAGLFPWSTLAVNVSGSFLLGIAFRYLDAGVLAPEWRPALTVGLLGAFTTFSTFSFEAVTLAQEGEWSRAGAYVLLSVSLAMGAVLAGLSAADLSLRGR